MLWDLFAFTNRDWAQTSPVLSEKGETPEYLGPVVRVWQGKADAYVVILQGQASSFLCSIQRWLGGKETRLFGALPSEWASAKVLDLCHLWTTRALIQEKQKLWCISSLAQPLRIQRSRSWMIWLHTYRTAWVVFMQYISVYHNSKHQSPH